MQLTIIATVNFVNCLSVCLRLLIAILEIFVSLLPPKLVFLKVFNVITLTTIKIIIGITWKVKASIISRKSLSHSG